MNKLSKGIVLISAAALTLGLAACGSSTNSDAGHVYFLNNKPEVVDQWNELADMYTKETGVQVDIQSATSGSYESTLSSELAKNNAPTMFGIGGFDQYAKYKNYLEPLQDSEAYKLLNEQGKQMAHKDGDDVYGLPYAAEWFGIIANKKIINEYAKKSYSVIKSFDDIKDFATLKKVADSIQQHKDDLGLDGAFSTPGLDASNYYRYASHMTQVPVAYEYIDEGVNFEKELKGTYLDNYKALWDLEMKDNPTENTMLGSVNYEDSTAEFSTGRVAFYPNGVWAYSQIKDNDVADEDLAMLPYYMGFPNESKYAANSIYDISWSVNKNASEKDKKATLDFIKWMVTNDDAKKILAKDMGFAVPFTTFDSEDFQPDNPLTKSALKLESDGLTPIHGAYIPGQAWADGVANALLEYAQGTGDWNGVKKAYLDDWTSAWNDYESNFGMLPPVHK